MESIALYARLVPNTIQKKSNVITVQKDSSEIKTVTPVPQDFEHNWFNKLLSNSDPNKYQ